MQELESFFKLLKKVADAFGVPGYEDEVRGIVVDELREVADELRIDRLGNVIAVKYGDNRGFKVIWDAHLDEIGFFVRHIDEKGFIYLAPAGGWSDHVIPGQRVRILTDHGNIVRGVIGVKPPHIMKPEEKTQVITVDKAFVDVGAASREEVEKMGIRVGSPVDLDRDTVRLASDRVTGKSFDDRVGVAVLLKSFKDIDNHEPTIYLVLAVQEEVGLKGARVAAQQIEPHLAFAVDVTIAADVPGVEAKERVVEVGKGPAITAVDGRNAGGTIVNPKLLRLLLTTAREHNIPVQLSVLTGGTTDATAISLVGAGVPSAVISIPTRYVHSPVELLSLSDAIYASRLVVAATKKLSWSWYVSEIESRRISRGR
jgi:endoglucanase